jgi:hypothetical protein
MHAILFYLLILVPGDSIKESYLPSERYNDSLHIYRTYKKLYEYQLKETDSAKLALAKERAHQLTCAAQKKLSGFNRTPYVIDTVSFIAPKPTIINHAGMFIESEPSVHYIAYDLQTRFILKPNGSTDKPYVRRLTFDKGRIIHIDTLEAIPKDGKYVPLFK